MLTKICTICEKTFSVENQEDFSKYFFRDKKGKYKHNARCKECCKIWQQKCIAKNPRKIGLSKAHSEYCIVCNKEFLAKSIVHNTCSDECRKFKNKVRKKLSKERDRIFYAKQRAKNIKKAIVRFKHYTDIEIAIVKKGIERDCEYKVIAKKLGRTTMSVGKIARKIKNGIIK